MKKILILFAIVIATSCTKHAWAQDSLTLNGITYSVHPSIVIDTIVEGWADKEFSVLIKQNIPADYSFSVGDNGFGFPAHGIKSMLSAGTVCGSQLLTFNILTKQFSAEGKKPKLYRGYLPIYIHSGSKDSLNSNCLKVLVYLVVMPRTVKSTR